VINETDIQAANFIWSVYFIILVDTLLLRPSLHFTTLHPPNFTPLRYTCQNFTSSNINFTHLHFTPLNYTCRHFTSSHLNFIQLHLTPLNYTCRHFTTSHLNFTQLHFTTLHYTCRHFTTSHLNFTHLHFTSLHYTCRHFTSSHLNFTQLHFTTLSFRMILLKLSWGKHISILRGLGYSQRCCWVCRVLWDVKLWCCVSCLRRFGRNLRLDNERSRSPKRN